MTLCKNVALKRLEDNFRHAKLHFFKVNQSVKLFSILKSANISKPKTRHKSQKRFSTSKICFQISKILSYFKATKVVNPPNFSSFFLQNVFSYLQKIAVLSIFRWSLTFFKKIYWIMKLEIPTSWLHDEKKCSKKVEIWLCVNV